MDFSQKTASFWEHLDDLRKYLIRIAVVFLLITIAAFCFKETLFSIILAPKNADFITYQWLNRIVSSTFPEMGTIDTFSVKLINTQLTQQFMAHIKMSFYVGFLLLLPYILFELFRFVSPALYSNERKYAIRIISASYVMFMLGVVLSYFLIFPLTFRFLGTYQVSAEVENQIVLDSYIGMLLMMNLLMGIIFEIPILCWLFAKLGFINAGFLIKYRRHAIVLMLILGAVITPTADAITLLLVSLPMYLLYELSIIIVRHTASAKKEEAPQLKI